MKSQRIARYALLTALAMVLSWLESMVPVATAVPGVKLGLTNLVVIFALYRMRLRDAEAISLIRVLLVSMTFGNAYSFAYSFAGAALSLAVMTLLKKTGKFTEVFVSVTGGMLHNIGQIGMACILLQTDVLRYYLPFLLVSGILAGIVIGLLAGILVHRIRIP